MTIYRSDYFTFFDQPGRIVVGEIVRHFRSDGCMGETVTRLASGRVVRVEPAHVYGAGMVPCVFLDMGFGEVPRHHPVSCYWRTQYGLTRID